MFTAFKLNIACRTKSSLDDASEDDTTLNKNKLGTEQEENIGMYSRDVRTPDSPRRMLHSDEEELELWHQLGYTLYDSWRRKS